MTQRDLCSRCDRFYWHDWSVVIDELAGRGRMGGSVCCEPELFAQSFDRWSVSLLVYGRGSLFPTDSFALYYLVLIRFQSELISVPEEFWQTDSMLPVQRLTPGIWSDTQYSLGCLLLNTEANIKKSGKENCSALVRCNSQLLFSGEEASEKAIKRNLVV